MGFFNLFKKKQEVVKEIERISLGDLDNFIGKKSEELDKEKKVFLDLVSDRKNSLIEELEKGMDDFDNINWEKVKEVERVKTIVQENLRNYSAHLVKLREDLKKSSGERKEVEKIFTGFDKKAAASYQKASFLIGKELEVINDSVGSFLKDLKNLEDENRELVDNFEVVSKIQEKINGLNNIDGRTKEINEEVKNINQKSEELQKMIKILEERIGEIKNGVEYKKLEEDKKNLEKDRERFDLQVKDLRNKIDFKKLSKDWHKNKKEMEFVKKYKDHFQETFEKDNGEVLRILISSLENKEDLNRKLKGIIKLNKGIVDVELGESLTLELEEKIGKLKKESESFKIDKEKEEKRIEKLDIEKVKVKGDIKKGLQRIDVELSN